MLEENGRGTDSHSVQPQCRVEARQCVEHSAKRHHVRAAPRVARRRDETGRRFRGCLFDCRHHGTHDPDQGQLLTHASGRRRGRGACLACIGIAIAGLVAAMADAAAVVRAGVRLSISLYAFLGAWYQYVQETAAASVGRVLGEVAPRTIRSRPDGQSGLQTFDLRNPQLATMGVGAYPLRWVWQCRVGLGPWEAIAITDHRIYVLLRIPTLPWR